MAVKKPSFKLSNGSLDVSSGQNAYVTRSCNGAIEIIKVFVFSTKLNILIIFGPVAIVVVKTSGAHERLGFLLRMLGIIPLAERLGFVTEQVSFAFYLWRSTKYYFQKFNRIDNIKFSIKRAHDACSSTIITRFYFIKHAAVARLCFLLWGTCSCFSELWIADGSNGFIVPCCSPCYTHLAAFWEV
ncbi:hypothetical protein CUMW_107750 [Citrus unshiu]|uniref:Uncharacterized protein n=1 Tax=Citrus unshiu TaxID=55188 RepID=A0A2H5P6A0_CITUN|nr:hypothetical protein CUMW_107750 [Citrus unshiu]